MNQNSVICDGKVEIIGLGDYYHRPGSFRFSLLTYAVF